MRNSPEHVDEAPATVSAKLLDRGVYPASVPTMYRVLRDHNEVHQRRRQATHPAATKPELLASRPNEVSSRDSTKLLGPVKWSWCYRYVDPRPLQPLSSLPEVLSVTVGEPG